MGYSPWGRKESDTTEQLHFHFHPRNKMDGNLPIKSETTGSTLRGKVMSSFRLCLVSAPREHMARESWKLVWSLVAMVGRSFQTLDLVLKVTGINKIIQKREQNK